MEFLFIYFLTKGPFPPKKNIHDIGIPKNASETSYPVQQKEYDRKGTPAYKR